MNKHYGYSMVTRGLLVVTRSSRLLFVRDQVNFANNTTRKLNETIHFEKHQHRGMNDKIPPLRHSLKRLHRYKLSFEFKSPVQIGTVYDEFLFFQRFGTKKVQKAKIFVKFRTLAAHLLVWLVASAVTSNNESIMTSQIGQSSSMILFSPFGY